MNKGCYDRQDLFRPLWPFSEPADSHDEVFVVGPFTLPVSGTGQLDLNLPVQLDDDVNFFMRAMSFVNISPDVGAFGVLARLRTTYGDPLSDGLIYSLGNWSNSGGELEAFGIPIEQEVECSPGGALLFDFQMSSNGSPALFDHTAAGETIQFQAAVMGAAGNGFTIAIVNPGAPNVPLSVAVVGTAVTVTLATNGASAITSTFAQVQAIINTTAAVQAVMVALLSGPNPATIMTALATTPLAGGHNGTPTTLQGCIIGVKRFGKCAQ